MSLFYTTLITYHAGPGSLTMSTLFICASLGLPPDMSTNIPCQVNQRRTGNKARR